VVDARKIAGALVTAAALCLEPFARRATINPIRYRDSGSPVIAAGLVLATAILLRRRQA
jgi:hypothetical protein